MSSSVQQYQGLTESHQGKRAFTLVELLVVVTVLALLLALLMPALAGARSQARAIVCRSNVHQLVLAATGYAAENDGFYVPAAKDMWDNAGRYRWHGVRRSLDAPFDASKGPLAGYLADGQVKEFAERFQALNPPAVILIDQTGRVRIAWRTPPPVEDFLREVRNTGWGTGPVQ